MGAAAPLEPQEIFVGRADVLFPELFEGSELPIVFESSSIETFQQIINSLPEQIALVDEGWNILAVNPAWIKTAAAYGYAELMPGTNYRDFCAARGAEGHTPAALACNGIAEIDAGIANSFRYTYHGRDRWEGYSFQLCIKRLELDGRTLATVTRYDVTELVQLRKLREQFGLSLLEGQAEDRRRVAREVHDSTMQELAALRMSLAQLKRSETPDLTMGIVTEMESLLAEAQRELRTISYLNHPPMLQKLGFAGALKALVEGFARRDGLKIALHIDEHATLDGPATELALYRVAQEALSNIHRHAEASEAVVALIVRRSMIHLLIADNGVGMPGYVRHGVGLPSMRSRLSEIGGRLTLRTGGMLGTTVTASAPVHPHIRAVGDLSIRF